MSNALAIASATAVLKDLMDNAVIGNSVNTAVGGSITVTALPPSRISVGKDEVPQLNIFLYHIAPNQSWRNVSLPSFGNKGERLNNPPLALDLYYILTAYGKESFEAEILLGYAMQLLHENPILGREAIRKSLASTQSSSSPIDSRLLPPAMEALKSSDLADQVELIKITPLPMNIEEMSKLWSAFQASYRPSVAYQMSVVLIESAKQSRSALPVLTIGFKDQGVRCEMGIIPSYPLLTEVIFKEGQLSAKLGDALAIKGINLIPGQAKVVLWNARINNPWILDVASSETEINVTIPPAPDPTTLDPTHPAKSTIWPSGVYTMSAVFGSGKDEVTTNEIALMLAPTIVGIDSSKKASVKATLIPLIRTEQRVSLILGSIEIPSKSRSSPTYTPEFDASSLPAGNYLARVKVDGVDNQFIDLSSTPPVFKGVMVNLP
jgi:hypothetical protein